MSSFGATAVTLCPQFPSSGPPSVPQPSRPSSSTPLGLRPRASAQGPGTASEDASFHRQEIESYEAPQDPDVLTSTNLTGHPAGGCPVASNPTERR